MERGKIYSFVGPAGGGKSYAALEVMGESVYNDIPVLCADFSDGIRGVVSAMLLGKMEDIDLNNTTYTAWKKKKQNIITPNGVSVEIDGRTMMKNIGEFLKMVVGNEIWATWTLNSIMRKYYELDIASKNACNIIFGSLRFDVEWQAIQKCSELTKKDINVIFCNYHDVGVNYTNNIHPSEVLAQSLINYGAKHREDITNFLL